MLRQTKSIGINMWVLISLILSVVILTGCTSNSHINQSVVDSIFSSESQSSENSNSSSDMFDSESDSAEKTLKGSDINVKNSTKRVVDGIGECFYVNVRNNQSIFRFTDYVEIANDAVFTISSDIAGVNMIPTRTVILEEGAGTKNVYYINVSNDVDKKYYVYPIIIHKNSMFTIIFDSCGGTTCDEQNIEEGYCLDEDKIPLPEKTGYIFIKWDYDFSKPINDNIVAKAIWTEKLNDLVVLSNNDSKGTVEVILGSGYSNEPITVKATPATDCVFRGWYHDDKKVSNDSIFSFLMPEGDYFIEGVFEDYIVPLGTTPVADLNNKTVMYGLYPQSNVNDPILLNELSKLDENEVEENGWYLYNNSYYAKVDAIRGYNMSSDNYCFDNGVEVIVGEVYWFKCEPIIWDIISADNNDYYLLSRYILDVSPYSKRIKTITKTHESGVGYYTFFPNNYKLSTIRSWLNGYGVSENMTTDFTNRGFYNKAFSFCDSYIHFTEVNNSPITTNSEFNSYAGGKTTDKVFLLSYADYSKASLEMRYSKPTDFAKAVGCPFDFADSTNGIYWTRSPYSGETAKPFYVNEVGELTYDYCNVNYGVRPACWIKL